MRGICMCVCGPPAGGVCGACGAVGQPLPGPNYPYPPWPPPGYPYWPAPAAPPERGKFYPENPLTPEEIRKIIREEIARATPRANEQRD